MIIWKAAGRADESYANVLRKLPEAIGKKRQGLVTRGVLLQGSTPVHRSRVGQAVIRECALEELGRPLLSPYLAPSDFFFIPESEETPQANKVR